MASVDVCRSAVASLVAVCFIGSGCYSGLEPTGEGATEVGSGSDGAAPDPDDDGPGADGADDDSADDGPASASDGADGPYPGDTGATGDPSTSDDGLPGDGSTGAMADDDGGVDPEVAEMCARWTSDRADLDEGSWSGSVASCSAGDISAGARDNALRLVNLYRWLADLPAVSHDASRNAAAQACALIMDANDSLDHSPPTSWSCWSSSGSNAAGKSNISTGQGVMSVDMYMVDFGNETTLGHRRWILSDSLGPIGLGSTSDSSCMWVFDGTGNADAAWTAYPPPGPFPMEAVDPLPFGDNLDLTGWSIQSDSIDLSGAAVTVTEGGQARPMSVTVLGANYGSASAISMIPQGWTAQAGATYHVEVGGVGAAVSYDVTFVDCDAL